MGGKDSNQVEAKKMDDQVVDKPPNRNRFSATRFEAFRYAIDGLDLFDPCGSQIERTGWRQQPKVENQNRGDIHHPGHRRHCQAGAPFEHGRSDDDYDKVENRKRAVETAKVVDHPGDYEQVAKELDVCLDLRPVLEPLQKADIEEARRVGKSGQQVEEIEGDRLGGGYQLEEEIRQHQTGDDHQADADHPPELLLQAGQALEGQFGGGGKVLRSPVAHLCAKVGGLRVKLADFAQNRVHRQVHRRDDDADDAAQKHDHQGL